MMNKREMQWCYAEDGNNINICHNCGSKMEDTDHYCKTCGAGRGNICDWAGLYGYKENIQMYSVKGFCNKCNLELSNIQPETESVYCPRCGAKLEPRAVSICRRNLGHKRRLLQRLYKLYYKGYPNYSAWQMINLYYRYQGKNRKNNQVTFIGQPEI